MEALTRSLQPNKHLYTIHLVQCCANPINVVSLARGFCFISENNTSLTPFLPSHLIPLVAYSLVYATLSTPIYSGKMEPPGYYADGGGGRNRLSQNATISRLPIETLGIIFELLQDTTFPPFEDRVKTEITISHVSRHWRDVAIHSPLLWTYIDVSPYQELDAIAAYVQRSEMCALTVHYGHPEEEGIDANEGVLNAYFDLVIPHVHRWKRVSLAAPSAVIEFIGLRFDLLAAPLLRQLSRVDLGGVFNYKAVHPDQCLPTVFLCGSPILSSIHMRLHDRDLPFCCPSFGTVKNLSLHFSHSIERFQNYKLVRQMLASSPLLENLYFQVDKDDYNIDLWFSDHLNPVKMPHLHSICIRSTSFNRGIAVLWLLLVIKAPQLHSLTLQSFNMCEAIDLQFLFDGPQTISGIPKFPLLRSLAFIDCTIDDLCYRRFSQYFSTISCLSVVYSYDDPGSQLLGDMARYPSGYEQWLNLDTISVDIRVLGELGDLLCQIMSNVNAVGRPLHKLRLNHDAPLAMERLEWLRKHVEVEPFLMSDENSYSLNYLTS